MKSYFHPSELGFIVNDLLVDNFPEIFNVEFTAKMENDLDRVETAEMDALSVLQSFSTALSGKVTAAEERCSVSRAWDPYRLTCPQCQQTICMSRSVKTAISWPAAATRSAPIRGIMSATKEGTSNRSNPVMKPRR